MDNGDIAELEARADEAARQLYESMDPSKGVGTRHHIVPKFLLLRFATDKQVVVRNLHDKRDWVANVDDLAIKDFYTAVVAPDRSGPVLDGRLEQLLCGVEGEAARILRALDASPQQTLSGDDRALLAQFVSFQLFRGVRQRLEIELLGEYHAKTTLAESSVDAKTQRKAAVRQARSRGRTPSRGNRKWAPTPSAHRLSDQDLRKLHIGLDPNAHLAMFPLAERLFPHIASRPVTVVDIDVPHLLLGDEPVLIFGDDERGHRPECFLTTAQRQKALRRAVKAGRSHRELVHVYPTRKTGLAVASDIVMPIAPDRVLWWGAPDTEGPSRIQLAGDDALKYVREVNDLTIRSAYLWIAARPDHPSIRPMELPDRTPVLQICDGDSAASAAFKVMPGMPQRLRKPTSGPH